MATELSDARYGKAAAAQCGRVRAPRPWTLEKYETLTESLVERFGPRAVMCATFRAVELNPGAKIDEILTILDAIDEDEAPEVWLRGVQAAMITIWATIRRIRASRLYKWVLKRFILFTLLFQLIEETLEKVTDLIEYAILHVEELRALRQILNCDEDDTNVR